MFFEEGFTDVKVTDEKSALEAVASVAEIIGIKDVEKDLKVVSTNTIDGDSFYRMQQQYNGIPVYGKEIILSVNDKGLAVGLNSNNVNDTVFENSNIEFKKLESTDFDVETVKAKAIDYFSDLFDEKVQIVFSDNAGMGKSEHIKQEVKSAYQIDLVVEPVIIKWDKL